MFNSFRVIRKTQFDIWIYGPEGPCDCLNADQPCGGNCTGINASGCACSDHGYCACGIKPYMYGGPYVLTPAGHNLVGSIRSFKATDGLTNTPDDLLKDPRYKWVTENEPKEGIIPFGNIQTPSTLLLTEPAVS